MQDLFFRWTLSMGEKEIYFLFQLEQSTKPMQDQYNVDFKWMNLVTKNIKQPMPTNLLPNLCNYESDTCIFCFFT